MTTPDPQSSGYAPVPRGSVPGWVWGVGACVCLPIVGVTVLALIAAPALKRLREARLEVARGSLCLTNIRQVDTGLQMYAQDYDTRFPIASSWMDSLVPYVDHSGTNGKTAFRCPTVAKADPKGFGYAYNSGVSGAALAKIAAPESMPIVYDSSKLERNATDAVASLPVPARHRPRRMRPNSPRVNMIGYVDGHVKAVPDPSQPDLIRRPAHGERKK